MDLVSEKVFVVVVLVYCGSECFCFGVVLMMFVLFVGCMVVVEFVMVVFVCACV